MVNVDALYMRTHATCSCSLTYSSVHNPSTMSPDGVGYVTNVDGVEVLVVGRALNKDLVRKRP